MTDTQAESLTGDYSFDPRTRLGFVVRHAMVTRVHGLFTEFEGRAHVDLVQPRRSSATVFIESSSIETGWGTRDANLRTSDFLAAHQHPFIKFQSSDVSRLDGNTLRVMGDLTIRGVSRSVSVDLSYSDPEPDPHGRVRLTLRGSTTINRRDWGVRWNPLLEAGALLVSEKVVLELHLCIVRTDSRAGGWAAAS